MAYKWWLLLGIAVCAFLINIDYTAVNLILVVVSEEFLASIATVKWILTAYVLFWMLFIIPGGRAADYLGQKKVALLGLGIFALSSYLATLSHSIEFLIMSRALQGIGGALFLPSMYVLISEAFAEEERGFAIGFLSVGVGVGAAIGPIIGGTLLTYFGWRSIFLINIPIYLIAMMIMSANKQSEHRAVKPQSLLTSIKGVIQNKNYLCCTLSISAQQFSFATILLSVGLYLQKVQLQDPFQASLTFMPLTLALGLISIVAGRWIDKHGVKTVALLGLVIVICSCLMMAKLNLASPIGYIIFVLLVTGLGGGFIFSALNAGLVKFVQPGLVGIGSSLFTMAALAGNFIGATLAVYLFEHSGIGVVMVITSVLLLLITFYIQMHLSSESQSISAEFSK